MASPERDLETLAQAPAFARRYSLGRLLGRGAMGVVYAGTHVAMRRPVAIKFLLKLGNREGQQRFLREARLMAEVQHPHVAQVFDFDELDGIPFLVTEFLDGGTLRAMLEGGAKLRPAETVAIAQELLLGLGACHEKGVIHRDLKPENILFSDAGAAKIADLGIARALSDGEQVTREGALLGTPLYMAPEQVAGERAGVPSDLYAVAVMVYEMLAGRTPFVGTNGMQVMRQQLTAPPPPLSELAPDAPAALVSAVHRALAKAPGERPASASAFAAELAAALPAPAAPVLVPAAVTSPGVPRPAAGEVPAPPAPAASLALTQAGPPPPLSRPRLPAPLVYVLAVALSWAGATWMAESFGPTAMDFFTTLILPEQSGSSSAEERLANVAQSRVVVIDTSDGATPAGVDRATLAKLVTRATELGASSVGLAVLLDRKGDPAADRALAAAIRASGRVVVANHYNRNTLAETRSLFAGDALAAGMVNLLVDPDGRARHLQNYFDEPAFQARHSLSLAMAALVTVSPRPPLPAPAILDDAIRFSGANGLTLEVPVDAEGASLLQYQGATGTIPRLSWREALSSAVPPGAFTGKAVLLGEAHPQSESSFPAPFFHGDAARVTAVEIHAQNLLGILAQVRRREAGAGIRRATMIAGTLGGCLIGLLRSRATAALIALGGAAAAVLGSYAAYASDGVFVDPVGPLCAGLFAMLAQAGLFRFAGRPRRMLPAAAGPAESTDENGVPASVVRALAHRFERLEPLGQGGMARVYRAHDRELGRAVAIKVPDEAMLLGAAARVRFEREARALAKLEHPNVIRIHAVGSDPLPYIAMELVDGPNLDVVMSREKPMAPARALAVLAPVAHALAYCHGRGVVHRDVKPGNILVDASGRPHLTDFGLAYDEALTRITRSSASVGTPLYMAPEQLEGQPPTPAVDVYAFGVMLYEAVAGEPPFGSGRLGLKLVAEAPPLSVPGIEPALAELVAGCLAREPAGRPADGRVLEERLRALVSFDFPR